MPPPNDWPPPPPPPGGGPVNPHVQQFLNMVTQALQGTMHNMLQEHLQQVSQTISPQGRPVTVNRRGPNKTTIQQPTTTPQLLAELCDHLIESNKLARKQLKQYVDDD